MLGAMVWLCACRPALDPDASRVVVLVMDGVRLEESFGEGVAADGTPTEAVMPHIRDALFSEAAVVTGGLTTAATLTSQGHVALLTGRALPYTNHYSAAEWSYRPALPTLFELLRVARDLDEDQVVFAVNAWHLAPLSHSLHDGFGEAVGAQYDVMARGDRLMEDDRVVDAVTRALHRGAQLVVANLHDADRNAHAGDVHGYVDGAMAQDEAIDALWAAVQEDDVLAETTTLVLVADHGRHRTGASGDWADHRDDCMGCRQVPMLLAGRGVQAGAVVDQTASLQDLSASIAALLGVAHPYTEGIPIAGALTVSAPVRTGQVALSAAGPHMASQVYLSDPSQRSLIAVDGEAVSAGMFAQAPRLAHHQQRTALCWRQMAAPDPDVDTLPWRAQCMTRSGEDAWQDISPTFSSVSFVWEPALVMDSDERIWLASIDHPTEVDEVPSSGGVWLQSWTETGGWSVRQDQPRDLFYPTHIDARPGDGTWWVGFAAGDSAAQSRSSRNIRLYSVTMDSDDRQEWTEVVRTQTQASTHVADHAMISTGRDRHERPSLFVDAAHVAVSFVSTDATGQHWVEVLESTDAGLSWSLDAVDGGVLSHVRPIWGEDGALYWARQGNETVQACRWTGAVDCVDTTMTVLDGLAIGDGVWCSGHRGDQVWQTAQIIWP